MELIKGTQLFDSLSIFLLENILIIRLNIPKPLQLALLYAS